MLARILGNKKPKDTYSLENLKYLYGTLQKEPIITNSNKTLVVEILRSIAELMVWGEQNSQPSFFDYFAEKNILSNFVRILSQKTDNKVKVQIIQSLSILVQNISSEVSIFYLLSNNYINDLIVHRFDFTDEDIRTQYITFLRALSFKLNSRTIPFGYNDTAQDFPLLNEAMKFCNYEEDSMIRGAVRTLTLNIYRINDLSLRRYLLTKHCIPYFSQLIWFLRDQTLEYDKVLHLPNVSISKLEVGMELLLDQFLYLVDVMECTVAEEAEDSIANDSSSSSSNTKKKSPTLYFQNLISEILLDQLLGYYILPLILGSLVPESSKVPAHMLISTQLSWYILCQVFNIFRDSTVFLNTIVSVLTKQKLNPLLLRMMQESPPRGPVRNSDGTPLTNLLYPRSAVTREANVAAELVMLTAEPEGRRSKRSSLRGPLITPKPVITSPKDLLFQTPTPPLGDAAAAANASATPAALGTPVLGKAGTERELQPIVRKPSDAATSEPSVASTTENGSVRKDSTSTNQSVAEPSTSSNESEALAPTALDFFAGADPAASASTNTTPTDSAAAAATTSTTSDAPLNTSDSFDPLLDSSVAVNPTALPPAASTSTPSKKLASPPPLDGWKCDQCTFVNQQIHLACAMCECVRPIASIEKSELDLAIKQSLSMTTPNQTPGSSVFNSPQPAATASSTSSSLTTPSASASSMKSPAREMPIDENSKARSKLPDVGPYYSPIDYFGFVRSSVPTQAGIAVAAVASAQATNGEVTPTTSKNANQCVPGMVATVQLDPKVTEETEENEYHAALIKYLEQAQIDAISNPTSPLFVVGMNDVQQGAPSERSSDLDERDLYGGLSVLYSLFQLNADRVDLDMLISSGLCSQGQRRHGQLFDELVMRRASTAISSPTPSGRAYRGESLLFASPTNDSSALRHRPAPDGVFAVSPPPESATSSSEEVVTRTRARASDVDLLTSKSSGSFTSETQPKTPTRERSNATKTVRANSDASVTGRSDLSLPTDDDDPLMTGKSPRRVTSRTTPNRVPSLPPSSSGSSKSKSALFPDFNLELEENKAGGDAAPTVLQYDAGIITSLLNLFAAHPPYRIVTLQTVVEIIKEMAFPITSSTSVAATAAAASTTAVPSPSTSYLAAQNVAQLDSIYSRMLTEFHTKLLDPLWNLFLIDLLEEEFPTYTSPGPQFASWSSQIKKIQTECRHLLPIEFGFVQNVPMQYRVQSSGLIALTPQPTQQAKSANGLPAAAAATPSTALTPVNELERLRKFVQVFLMLRNLRLKNMQQFDDLFYSLPSTAPPPANTSSALQPPQSQLFHISHLSVSQEVCTAHHPDAMLCTLHLEAKKKAHLFFVMDDWDLVLVELQQQKQGMAIVQLRQSLRHQEAFLNRANACLLHLTFRSATKPHAAARKLTYPGDSCFKSLWCVSLLFLDALQCARAWKHLDARRMFLRKNILTKLCTTLDLPLNDADMTQIATSCTSIQAFPAVEIEVHKDSTLFGVPIPHIPLPVTVAPAPIVTAAAPSPSSASSSAQPVVTPAVSVSASTVDLLQSSSSSSSLTAPAAASTQQAAAIPVAQPIAATPSLI